MKVALVHDWLVSMGGAEKLLLAFHEMFPEAPIYVTVYDAKKTKEFAQAKIIPSFIQKWPLSKRFYQYYLPLMPLAVEQHDLREFDLVISISHSCAKGIITKPETTHICYCCTPMRYIWQGHLDKRAQGGFIKQSVLNYLRIWDLLASNRVEQFVSISKTTASRVKKYYRRDSEIIYPPVDASLFKPVSMDQVKDYYLFVSRLIPYKKADLVIKAFNDLGLPLKIIGHGPELPRLQKMAKENIQFLGHVSNQELTRYYAQARGLIFPAEEDFGIVPLEAMASGRPVIAYNKGGATETVKEGITGTFFDEQTPQCLIETVKKFHPERYNPSTIRQHALDFDKAIFKNKWQEYIKKIKLRN